MLQSMGSQRVRHNWATELNTGSIPGPGRSDPLEKEMATHSSILAWDIPWTDEPDRLQSRGSQKVGQN